MARQFDDVTLNWGGVDYLIPSDRMMEAICRIEQHVSIEDLQFKKDDGSFKVKRASLACAYASVLRLAGAKVEDADVYAGMFAKGTANTIIAAVSVLSVMMIPKGALEGVTTGKQNRQARRAAGRLSGKRSRSRAGRESTAASV